MAWLRWGPATAGLVCLFLLLSPLGPLLAQGALEEVPFDRKLLAVQGVGGDKFGAALAVSGEVMVVSAPSATVDGRSFAGAALVFQRDPASGKWVERKRLVAEDGFAFDQLGDEVAIDGDTIVVAASFARVNGNIQQGAAYLFERNQGGADNWGLVTKLTEATASPVANFGSSLALRDGLLAVGSSRGGTNGRVTIFERDRGGPGSWGRVTTIADIEVGDGGNPLESFGGAVALDGDLLLVGAPSADVSFFSEDDGAAYLFRRDAVDRDRWSFVTRLTAPEATLCPRGRTLAEVSLDSLEVRLEVQRCAREESKTDRDGFGGAIALEGDIAIIGAAATEGGIGLPVGAVHIFRQDPTSADGWEQIAKLTGSDVLESTSPAFGRSIALAGETLLVGASGVEVGTKADQGAAYLFQRHAGGADAWGEVARLVAGDGLSRENFGAAVAFDGGDGAIGASGYEAAQGAVYLAGEEKPPEPAFAATGELVDGGVVAGPGGAVLGTVTGTIADPLPVWIVEVPPPDEQLLDGATTRGPYYNIGASQTMVAADGAPFGLALPVPNDAETTHLAAAVLMPASNVVGSPQTGAFWSPLIGIYDAETNLFSIALDMLALDGSTLVLIEHPDIAPLAPPPPLGLRESGAEFDVVCQGFVAPIICDAAVEAKFEFFLAEGYATFTELGYVNPALRKHTMRLETPGQFIVFPATVYYGNHILPVGNTICADTTAQYKQERYIFFGKKMEFCYSPVVGIDEDRRALSFHELFHAFQFGFAGIPLEQATTSQIEKFKWVIEGTATAAENSTTTMARDTLQDLHPVDHALTSVEPINDPYRAQDFWVYFGQKNNLGLDYLQPLFERGSTTEAAARFFAEVHGTTLATEYWAWVKNQAFEKAIDLAGALRTICVVESSSDHAVIGSVIEVDYPSGGPEGPAFPVILGSLPGLTAEVVRITMRDAVGRTTVTAGEQQAGLAYKVYRNGEIPCTDAIADGLRTFEEADLAEDDIVYVILANTEHQPGSRIAYKLEVKPATP